MEEPDTRQTKKNMMENDYLGLGYSMPQAPWLDVRVFYVRVSFCSLEEAPDILTIRYGIRDVSSNLEINGSRVPASDDVALNLRRDRMDSESSEVIYVGTDRLRTTGSLNFEICHREDCIIKGTLEKSDVWLDGQGLDRIGTVGTPAMTTKSFKSAWVMECKCAISSQRCIFLKRKCDGSGTPSSPMMEVYVTGRYAGSPVILTQTVELVLRRKLGRWNTLDSIPEVDESERSTNNLETTVLANQVEESSFYRELDNKPLGAYDRDSYLDGDEGEITWFNAGVRVGVGLGLGMCVGLGIGVGLMMRAYQSTTRTLKRRFL